MLTAQQLATIHARCSATTPGPWDWEIELINITPFVRGYLRTRQNATPILYSHTTTMAIDALQVDANFIAHARRDIPALLAEVARLQKLLQKEVPA